MRFHVWILVLVLLVPFIGGAQEAGLNAGFVDGLWYSHEPVFAEDTVRIYVALRNNTNDDLTGTVVFEDNGEIFATRKVSAISGRLVEAWADWNASYGEHTINATLTDIEIDGVGNNNSYASVTSALAEDFLIIDYDTDGDNIGNPNDEDDDNDGVSDLEEIKNGTDPLTPDQPEEDEAEEQTTSDDSDEETEEEIIVHQTTVDDGTTAQAGLENYFDEGPLETTFNTLTQVVNTSKQNLDRYRERRALTRMEGEIEPLTELATSSNEVSEATTTRNNQVATITRTRVDDDSSIFTTIGSVLSSIVGALYTFVLWILSLLLGYPALLEIALLLFILWFIYRTARRLARRPIDR